MYGCAKMGMHFVAYGPEELAEQIDQRRARKTPREVAADTQELSSKYFLR